MEPLGNGDSGDPTSHPPGSSADRAGDRTARRDRLLIIGLDGATFDVLNPMMAEGRMPRLARTVAQGVSGILRSTTPPITPAAWTTFLTGKQPGSHGIIDFERYDVHTNRLQFNSTRALDHVRTIWRILGDRGLKIGSINVPMTYPAVPVNGFMISGFETPGPDSDFVYPPDLKEQILERWPDPTLRSKWRRKVLGGNGLFARNLAYMADSFHQGAAMVRQLGDEHGWDVLMVVLKLVDNLQHKAWKYLDPRWSDRNPTRRDIAKRGFDELDKAIGDMLDYAEENRAAVMMVSDHGHGSLEGKVHPNLLLQQWGYLTLRGGGAQGTTRGRYILDRMRGRTGKFARDGSIEHDLAVDFSATRACVMHAGMAGFLYINLEGRQPTGIVPPSEYERLRDELTARLLGTECRTFDPQGRAIQLFKEVCKPEELYGCSREDQPWLPDLLLTPHDSLACVRKIRGRRPVRWLSYRKLEGTHRAEGVLIATGPGIARRRDLSAHIVDCAPTILAMLQQPVPDDMDGRVLTELFETPPTITTEAADTVTVGATAPSPSRDDAFSEDELQEVRDRLADLGYLE